MYTHKHTLTHTRTHTHTHNNSPRIYTTRTNIPRPVRMWETGDWLGNSLYGKGQKQIFNYLCKILFVLFVGVSICLLGCET